MKTNLIIPKNGLELPQKIQFMHNGNKKQQNLIMYFNIKFIFVYVSITFNACKAG